MTSLKDDFDADTTHRWAEQWRIPLVTSPYPRWNYEVALVVPFGDDALWRTVWPTDFEAELVASLIDYRRSYYNDSYQRKMLSRSLDVDGSTNSKILLKTEDGWYYRLATWHHGPWPLYNTPAEVKAPFTPDARGLVALMDRMYTIVDHVYDPWLDWKRTHPIFEGL